MNTENLIKQARARFKHQESRVYLQEKWNSRLTLSSQGGFWNITPQFLSFLGSTPSQQAELVLLDTYDRPIKINVEQLRTESWNHYNTVMIQWHDEFMQLEQNR
jgi:hypothetical protein